MIIPKIVICPICNKKTYLRIQDGGYLNEYPIRFHCANCHALIKGIYIMGERSEKRGLQLYNAIMEECEVDKVAKKITNADYVIEISGELPCKKVQVFDGNLINNTPFLEATKQIDVIKRMEILRKFTYNMNEWKKWRSIAFQLLSDGSISYLSTALRNKIGPYVYKCDHFLKSLHCLQEVVLEESNSLFYTPNQNEVLERLTCELSEIDRESLHAFVEQIGGIEEIVSNYRKIIDVFASFIEIYPNVLPAETFIRFKDKTQKDIGIATCSFGDIKSFYQDAYETLLSLSFIPVCLDNILIRGSYLSFNKQYDSLFKRVKYANLDDDYHRYIALDNGMKLEQLSKIESMQRILDVPANRYLRNGIGHNNIKYNGLTQEISIFDKKDSNAIKLCISLMDMAIDCIGLAKSSVIMAEILLFILRQELQREGIHSITHPKLYQKSKPNDKCPCGSNKKYKKCCKLEVERLYIAD